MPVIRALQVGEAERVRRHALEAAAKRLHKGEEDVLELLSASSPTSCCTRRCKALNSHHGQAKAELTDALARGCRPTCGRTSDAAAPHEIKPSAPKRTS
ncbi:MAG: hypothetical protein U1E47_07200 [Rivihabitans pingtungensis]